jgi:hypothetical protein
MTNPICRECQQPVNWRGDPPEGVSIRTASSDSFFLHDACNVARDARNAAAGSDTGFSPPTDEELAAYAEEMRQEAPWLERTGHECRRCATKIEWATPVRLIPEIGGTFFLHEDCFRATRCMSCARPLIAISGPLKELPDGAAHQQCWEADMEEADRQMGLGYY